MNLASFVARLIPAMVSMLVTATNIAILDPADYGHYSQWLAIASGMNVIFFHGTRHMIGFGQALDISQDVVTRGWQLGLCLALTTIVVAAVTGALPWIVAGSMGLLVSGQSLFERELAHSRAALLRRRYLSTACLRPLINLGILVALHASIDGKLPAAAVWTCLAASPVLAVLPRAREVWERCRTGLALRAVPWRSLGSATAYLIPSAGFLFLADAAARLALARRMSPDDFGRFSALADISLSAAWVVTSAATWGFIAKAMRQDADERSAYAFAQLRRVGWISVAICVILLLASAWNPLPAHRDMPALVQLLLSYALGSMTTSVALPALVITSRLRASWVLAMTGVSCMPAWVALVPGMENLGVAQVTTALVVVHGMVLAAAITAFGFRKPSTKERGARSRRPSSPRTIMMFANTDWYLYNFRLEAAKAIEQHGDRVILVSPPGRYAACFQAHGLPWFPTSMRRASLHPADALRTILWLRGFLQRHQVDILHAFTIKCVLIGGVAARLTPCTARVAAIAGLGAIFTVDSLPMRALRQPVAWALRWALGGADARVIVQNHDDAREVIRRSLARSSAVRTVLGSGVDLSKFQRLEERGPGRLTVLLAARLLRSKGVPDFFQAEKLLVQRGHDIAFLLAGEPDPENPDSVTEAELEQWLASGDVQWLGHVQDMPSLLSRVDIFALPTFYGEGLPRSLIEAAACQLALITTDVPGCREIVAVNERDGLQVKPRCPESLADAIARLDGDRTLLRRLQHAARARAEEFFGIRHVIHATGAIYDELRPRQHGTDS